MVAAQRVSGRARPGERLVGALLAALALLALPVSLGLELHHADHHGTWIAAEPASAEAGPSETGQAEGSTCPICLAAGQSGSAALRTSLDSEPAPEAAPAARQLAAAPAPATADLGSAGPRAPPHA